MPISVNQKCHKCSGTGTWTIEYDSETQEYISVTCPDCSGSGRLELAIVDSLMPDNVFYSYQVFEATDLSEYNALTDAQKSRYQLIMNMGQVDLNSGSNARGLLENMFGPGTTTRQNILALLS